MVAGMTSSGMGAKLYEQAIKTSLKEPSPSNRVVRHQFASTNRNSGTTTPISCAHRLLYRLRGLSR